MRRVLAALAAISLTVSLAACAPGAPEPIPSDDHASTIAATVLVGDNFYDPVEVTIAPGQAVRWEWVGRELHDVVSDDRSFVSELVREGSYVHIFDDLGEFSYLCSTHPEMRGVVIVKEPE